MKSMTRAEAAAMSRAEFSSRLSDALAQAGYPECGPTLLAQLFNGQYRGAPITVHAARKWIVGEAIPTKEKIDALARMLGTKPEYLAFGSGAAPQCDGDGALAPEAAKLLSQYRNLPAERQKIVRRFVSMLVRD